MNIESNIWVTVILNPARAFLGAWARGGRGVPAAHNSKTIHGIEIKFGMVIENHKLIKLV